MRRLWLAFINSMRALRYLMRHEAAIQQELGLFLLSIPASFYIASTYVVAFLLSGSILFLILVEVLNTAIEAACNAISREFDADIQLAKDCGSLAVLISVILVGGLWIYALLGRFVW